MLILRQASNRFLSVLILSIGVFVFSIHFAHAARFQVETNGTLTNGLVSYYKLESDGIDSIATNTLAVSGAPAFGSAYGYLNNGVYTIASSSQWLSDASPNNLPLGNASRTIAVWFNASPNNLPLFTAEDRVYVG